MIQRGGSYEIKDQLFHPLISSNSEVETNMYRTMVFGTAESLDKLVNYRGENWKATAGSNSKAYDYIPAQDKLEYQKYLDSLKNLYFALGPKELEDVNQNPGKYYMKIKNTGKINNKSVDIKISIMSVSKIDDNEDYYSNKDWLNSHHRDADKAFRFLNRHKITNDFLGISLPFPEFKKGIGAVEKFGDISVATSRGVGLKYELLYSDGTPVQNDDGKISATFSDIDYTQNIQIKDRNLIAYSKGSHILNPRKVGEDIVFGSKAGEAWDDVNRIDRGEFWGLFSGDKNSSVMFKFDSDNDKRGNGQRSRWQELANQNLNKSLEDFIVEGPNGRKEVYVVEGGSFGFDIRTTLLDTYSSKLKKTVSDNDEVGTTTNTILSKDEYITYSINGLIPNKKNSDKLSKFIFSDKLKGSNYKENSLTVKIGQKDVTSEGKIELVDIGNGEKKLVWTANDSFLNNKDYQGKTITYTFQAKPSQNKSIINNTAEQDADNYPAISNETTTKTEFTDEARKLTVKYIHRSDNGEVEIKESKTEKLEFDKNYLVDKPEITGYKFKETDSDLTGKLTEDKVIKLYYSKYVPGPEGDKGEPGDKGQPGDKGEKGEPGTGNGGAPGRDGETPDVRIDPKTGNWIVNGKDTGVSVFVKNGKDGKDGKDGNTDYNKVYIHYVDYDGNKTKDSEVVDKNKLQDKLKDENPQIAKEKDNNVIVVNKNKGKDNKDNKADNIIKYNIVSDKGEELLSSIYLPSKSEKPKPEIKGYKYLKTEKVSDNEERVIYTKDGEKSKDQITGDITYRLVDENNKPITTVYYQDDKFQPELDGYVFKEKIKVSDKEYVLVYNKTKAENKDTKIKDTQTKDIENTNKETKNLTDKELSTKLKSIIKDEDGNILDTQYLEKDVHPTIDGYKYKETKEIDKETQELIYTKDKVELKKADVKTGIENVSGSLFALFGTLILGGLALLFKRRQNK